MNNKYSYLNIDLKATGVRILLLLDLHGLTMSELAMRIGVSSNAVSDWIHGRREPKLVYVVRLMDVLEVSFCDLIVDFDP